MGGAPGLVPGVFYALQNLYFIADYDIITFVKIFAEKK